ncbi:MAG: ribonucleotide-diphosphate reductase subunit beta [Crocosphaera sp.]|nr:ribonucleotide-diphosphate reductase subunit beta [Crocosphaera sp.]
MPTTELVKIMYPEVEPTESNLESYYLLRLMNSYGVDINGEEVSDF